MHSKYKQELLKDVNSNLLCDLLIHTSTITSGISIET